MYHRTKQKETVRNITPSEVSLSQAFVSGNKNMEIEDLKQQVNTFKKDLNVY
jgi:hypothetical protein